MTLLILVFLFCSILGVFLIIKSPLEKRFKINHYYTKWIFLGYLSILLVLSGWYLMLPKQANHEIYSGIETIEEKNTAEDISPLLLRGKIEDINKDYIKKRWEFSFQGERLNMYYSHGVYPFSIIVEHKTNKDGKIEAFFIQTPLKIGDYDITDMLKPMQINIKGNRFLIEMPEPAKLEFNFYVKDSVITQFIGGKKYFEHISEVTSGDQYVYIRIPKGISIQNDNSDIPVEYVE